MPRSRLSRESVVDAALALADEVGVEGLSMRALAQRLGVDPMAIYRHVRDKDELLGAMCDEVVAEVAATALTAQDSWQEQVRHFAVELRTALHRRPTLVPVMARAPVTAVSVAVHQRGVDALIRQGLSPGRATTAIVVVFSYVFGVAALELSGAPDIDDRRKLADDARALLGGDDEVDLEPVLRSYDSMEGVFAEGLDVIVTGLGPGT